MLVNMSAKQAKPTNYCLPRDSGVGSDKAARLSSAIEQGFQGHTAKFGCKTLMSIAYSARSN